MCAQAAFSIILTPEASSSPILQVLPTRVRPPRAGLYSAPMSVTAAGNYSVSVQYDFQDLPGSPFAVAFLPQAAAAAMCRAGGQGLQLLIAGVPAQVTIAPQWTWIACRHQEPGQEG